MKELGAHLGHNRCYPADSQHDNATQECLKYLFKMFHDAKITYIFEEKAITSVFF